MGNAAAGPSKEGRRNPLATGTRTHSGSSSSQGWRSIAKEHGLSVTRAAENSVLLSEADRGLRVVVVR